MSCRAFPTDVVRVIHPHSAEKQIIIAGQILQVGYELTEKQKLKANLSIDETWYRCYTMNPSGIGCFVNSKYIQVIARGGIMLGDHVTFVKDNCMFYGNVYEFSQNEGMIWCQCQCLRRHEVPVDICKVMILKG